MISGDTIKLPGFVFGATVAQFTPVMISSTAARTLLQCITTTRVSMGVALNGGAVNVEAEVAVAGIVKVVAGSGVLLRGASLTCNSTGAIPQTSDNSRMFGIALDSASAKGDLVSVLLTGPARY